MQLPRLYPVTDTRISGLTHAGQVERLIAGGATFIQLRDKRASPDEFYRAVIDALAIARPLNVKIIINDRVDIALATKARGVHLGQDDLPPKKARELLGPGAIIGFSTHTLEQATDAAKLPVDYIAFGPIFPTKTKEDPDPTVGLETLSRVKNLIGDIPLVAIGGIDGSNIRDVLAAGADSAAVISYLLSEPNDITAHTSEIFNIVGK